jgi:hypothetical protein
LTATHIIIKESFTELRQGNSVLQLPNLRPCLGQLSLPRYLCCGVATCMRNALKNINAYSTPRCCNCIPGKREKFHPAPYHGRSHGKGGNVKDKSTTSAQGILWEGGRSSLSYPYQSILTQLDFVKRSNTTNTWEKLAVPRGTKTGPSVQTLVSSNNNC